MENKWDTAMDPLSKITVFSNPNNEPVTVYGYRWESTRYPFERYFTIKWKNKDI